MNAKPLETRRQFWSRLAILEWGSARRWRKMGYPQNATKAFATARRFLSVARGK